VKLPTRFRIKCLANSKPIPGILVRLTTCVYRKNSFNTTSNPTDDNGETVITWSDIEADAVRDRNLFIMDYTGVGDFSGLVVVKALNREDLERTLVGYEHWRRHVPFRPNYADEIAAARRTLEGLAPVELTVEVEHDGEGIEVMCGTVQA
jgi:hypothetical protein